MSLEKVRAYFEKYGIADRIMVLDASSETVFPACGSGNSAIELTIPELEKYSGYERWADVCKLPE